LVKYIIFIIISTILYANQEFYKIAKEAEDAYKNAEYKKALKLYKSIDIKSEKIIYNIANTLYKLKKYEEAIKYYKMVTTPKLQAKILYNIANSYVGLNQYKKAIPYYKSSLKYKDSNNTKYNLRVVKEIIQNQIPNISCRVQSPFESNMEQELKDFDNEAISKNLKEANYTKTNIQNNLSKSSSSVQSSQIEPTKPKKEDRKKINTRTIEKQYKEEKIDNMLNNRELKTLLIPITKENKDEN